MMTKIWYHNMGPLDHNELLHATMNMIRDPFNNLLLNSIEIYSTHLPPDKMATISQTTFSNAYSGMKKFKFWLEFHWSLLLKVQMTKNEHWFR